MTPDFSFTSAQHELLSIVDLAQPMTSLEIIDITDAFLCLAYQCTIRLRECPQFDEAHDDGFDSIRGDVGCRVSLAAERAGALLELAVSLTNCEGDDAAALMVDQQQLTATGTDLSVGQDLEFALENADRADLDPVELLDLLAAAVRVADTLTARLDRHPAVAQTELLDLVAYGQETRHLTATAGVFAARARDALACWPGR